METYLPKLNPDEFTWQRWRAFDLFYELGIACRKFDLINNQDIIKKYAIGYLPGINLYCRPKENDTAILFWYNGEYQWCHLKNDEFEIIFKDKPIEEYNMADISKNQIGHLINKPIKKVVYKQRKEE